MRMENKGHEYDPFMETQCTEKDNSLPNFM